MNKKTENKNSISTNFRFENLFLIFCYVVLFLVPFYILDYFFFKFPKLEGKNIYLILSFLVIALIIIGIFIILMILYSNMLIDIVNGGNNIHLFENMSIGFVTASIFLILSENNVYKGMIGILMSFILLGLVYYYKK